MQQVWRAKHLVEEETRCVLVMIMVSMERIRMGDVMMAKNVCRGVILILY